MGRMLLGSVRDELSSSSAALETGMEQLKVRVCSHHRSQHVHLLSFFVVNAEVLSSVFCAGGYDWSRQWNESDTVNTRGISGQHQWWCSNAYPFACETGFGTVPLISLCLGECLIVARVDSPVECKSPLEPSYDL